MSRRLAAQPTGLEQTVGFDRLPTPRGTGLLPLLAVSAALFGGVLDEGTHVVGHVDYRPLIAGTSLATVQVEGPIVPFRTPTRMARIRALAPLSFRDWAPVFGVTHSAIKQWTDGDEPDRDKLNQVLGALHEAASYQSDLARWLTAPVPGMDLRPVDLLREDRWRAFRGALRARSAPAVAIAPDELMRRRQSQVSWAVPEPATDADEA